jgi:hypothetical protein
LAPAGSWLAPKSAERSDPFFTLALVTASFLICFLPTLLAGSTIAA